MHAFEPGMRFEYLQVLHRGIWPTKGSLSLVVTRTIQEGTKVFGFDLVLMFIMQQYSCKPGKETEFATNTSALGSSSIGL